MTLVSHPSLFDHLPLAMDRTMRKTPSAMETCPNERFCSLGRFNVSTLLVLAFVLAAMLSVSPAMHERLHSDAASSHLCVVTLFASGHCASVSAPSAFSPPEAAPLLSPLPFPPLPSLASAHFFALLEHAPPARA